MFSTAVDAINTLIAAQSAGRLKQELNKYLKPYLLVLDELGYLPIDKTGADMLFQVISHRYERGSLIITTRLSSFFHNMLILLSSTKITNIFKF